MKLRQWIGHVALYAIAWLASPIQSAVQATDFLDPEDAFRFSATVAEDGRSVAAHFSIADGYYLYHERFAFVASDGVRLGTPQYPPGKVKFDETFNKEVLTYRGDVVVRLPVESGSGAFTLTASLQGCADRGLCYPPEQRTAQLLLTAASNASAPPGAGTASAGSGFVTATEQGRIDIALKSGSLLTVLPIFFDGRNSDLFQLLGLIHPRLRTAWLPREVERARDTTVTLRIGSLTANGTGPNSHEHL